MAVLLLSSTGWAVVGAIGIALYLLYRAALPKPLPGIPYNEKSARSIWGDIPGMIAHQAKAPVVFDWFTNQNIDRDSPICQLFLGPFSKPIVVLQDARESTDIMMRRTPREFDRSTFFADVFVGTIPDHHIVQKTNARFKAQRRLLADTMSTGFLNNVAAKHLYRHSLELMELWRVKLELAQGHAFDLQQDINHMALDAIWAVSFGNEVDTVRTQRDFLKAQSSIQLPTDPAKPVELPMPVLPEAFTSLIAIVDSMEMSMKSPFPRQTHTLIRQFPSYKRNDAIRNRLMQERLDDAKTRLLQPEAKDADVDCATDHMVFRERQAAEKESRAPEYDTPAAKDELFGFLIAGHDTTSTTVAWGVKYLAGNQTAQDKLRAALHAAYPEAYEGGVLPSYEEINKTDVPYLDAVIEEILRLGLTAGGMTRMAMVDTEVLGHRIPKGTDVWLMCNGPGYVTPDPFTDRISESQRSPSSRESRDRAAPAWNNEDITAFKPERWIKPAGEGAEDKFDLNAGPTRQFGAGPRGCFGKKLSVAPLLITTTVESITDLRRRAYMEMRILFTIMIWSFELPKLAPELSSFAAIDKLTHRPLTAYGKPRWLGAEKVRRDSGAA